jgi:hypothetical protein
VLEDVDGDVRGEMVDAVQRSVQRERVGLGGGNPGQERAGQPRPRGDRDGIDVGVRPRRPAPGGRWGAIASKWARLATSGTTPPNRTCCSTLFATASASKVAPRTIPTPVSSHEVSMPSTSGSSGTPASHMSGMVHRW